MPGNQRHPISGCLFCFPKKNAEGMEVKNEINVGKDQEDQEDQGIKGERLGMGLCP
ncbi:hypothetical protein ACFFMO_05080 [Lederbergia wuyishanensis]